MALFASLNYFLKWVFLQCIQGGSDISGTLSKPHRCIKKSYIFPIILHKPSQLCVLAETKTNRHGLAKVNRQEAPRAVIVYGLRAGWTLKEIISHEDIKKNTFKAVLKRKIGELFATGGSADVLIARRKVYKMLSDCMWTFRASTLQELITTLQIWVWSVSNIRIHVEYTKLLLGSKYLIMRSKYFH